MQGCQFESQKAWSSVLVFTQKRVWSTIAAVGVFRRVQGGLVCKQKPSITVDDINPALPIIRNRP